MSVLVILPGFSCRTMNFTIKMYFKCIQALSFSLCKVLNELYRRYIVLLIFLEGTKSLKILIWPEIKWSSWKNHLNKNYMWKEKKPIIMFCFAERKKTCIGKHEVEKHYEKHVCLFICAPVTHRTKTLLCGYLLPIIINIAIHINSKHWIQ